MKTAEETTEMLKRSMEAVFESENKRLDKYILPYFKRFESEIRKDQVNKCVDAVRSYIEGDLKLTMIGDATLIKTIQNTIKENNDRNGDQTSRTGND